MAPFSFSGEKSSRGSKSKTSRGASGKRRTSESRSSGKGGERKESSARSASRRPDSKRPDSRRTDSRRTDSRRPDSKRVDRDRRPPRGGVNREPSRSEEERRLRNFETPSIPADITGEELEKKILFQLESLTPGNAKSVARHMVALDRFLELDPNRAHMHGKEISFRAGRLGIVREKAGVAALRAGEFKEALKELRAANRISGSLEIEPFIAQCEAALGNARKALEIAGNVPEAKLSKAGRVEMRIAAAIARKALGQFDAAVLTLKCNELNTSDATWSRRLHTEYRDALLAAGREKEASEFEARFPQSFLT